MFFRNSLILFIIVAVSIVRNTLGIGILPDVDADRVFDQELYQSVLDPELCARQLQYIRNEDLSLRLEFLDSGLRFPRGILLGNNLDFGNFPQCLSINKEVEDMIIQGKHCMINVPLDFSSLQSDHNNLTGLSNEKNIRFMNEIKNNRDLLLAREGISTDLPSRTGPVGSFSFMVSICVPQACTVKEALGSTIFNLTGDIGENFSVTSCRLPNDKPFVTADYIAWTIFSLIGLITVLSTMYDVHHTLILKKDPKEANELYGAFSVYKNSCKIINLKTRPGTLECLDGIRSLSIMWVILGHTFMMGLFFPVNPLNVFEWYVSTKAIWMKTAPLAVDTFFLLSGLLVVYTTASKFTAIKLLKSLHLFYLHRFLRLMPVLAAVILFVSSIQLHVGDGAAWGVVARDVEVCRSYWWSTLLHLQNFLQPRGGCVGESWYLAIDMHLHILSPIVLFWVFSGAKRPAWIALLSTFVISLLAASIYIFLKDISDENWDDKRIYYYVNILTRAPPFFVGMIYGYLLHTFRGKKCGLSKAAGYSLTIFVLALTALVLYCSHLHLHGDISWTVEKIFLCFERTTWVICVGWIIFACVNGYAGPINWFLSMSVWKIPSRISYSMYLSHMTIIMYAYHSSSVSLVYFTVPFFMFDFMGYLYLTMFVSFFMTAIIDLPFATLFRILLMGGNKTEKKPISNPANGAKPEA